MTPQTRTLVSFSALITFALAVLVTFYIVQTANEIGGTPAPYRKALEVNGRIWKNLFSLKRKNTCPAPKAGRVPRENGDLGLDDEVDPAAWSMTVIADSDDAKSARFQLKLQDLKALPRTESSSEFRCIEGWSDEISYAGVKFSDFLRAYHLPPKAYVGLVTADEEYYVSIDIDSMMHDQTILAYEMNGLPLRPENGAPLRLVIPVKYGIKSLKRIGRIFLSDHRPPDYWAERGYDWYAGL